MPSFQARIAEKLLRIQFSGWSKGSIDEQRSRQEQTAKFTRFPNIAHFVPVDIHGISAEWIESENSGLGIILYLHGGAYALGSINVHREFLSRLAGSTLCKVLAINYRLAPEHPFPAALEDAVVAYRWLLAQGTNTSRIVIAGDSAGGGLALAALVYLRDAGDPLPAGCVCISPWVDLALTGSSIHRNAKIDPILDPPSLEMYARYYADGQDVRAPLISPLYADLSNLPPMMIHVGTHEILFEDAVRLVENARQAGVDVDLEIWDGMFHVFPIVPFIPETQKALAQIAEFCRKRGLLG